MASNPPIHQIEQIIFSAIFIEYRVFVNRNARIGHYLEELSQFQDIGATTPREKHLQSPKENEK